MKKAKFHYCQREIEEETRCKIQCEHCKSYYKPLEETWDRRYLQENINDIKQQVMAF